MKREAPREIKKLVPIPPQSVVRLAYADRSTPTWRKQIGRIFRVGYYMPNDGLDCIWLVNDDGKYEQTVDHEGLYKYFDIIYLAEAGKLWGRRQPSIPAIRPANLKR